MSKAIQFINIFLFLENPWRVKCAFNFMLSGKKNHICAFMNFNYVKLNFVFKNCIYFFPEVFAP